MILLITFPAIGPQRKKRCQRASVSSLLQDFCRPLERLYRRFDFRISNR
jgi:hypothetical protein